MELCRLMTMTLFLGLERGISKRGGGFWWGQARDWDLDWGRGKPSDGLPTGADTIAATGCNGPCGAVRR